MNKTKVLHALSALIKLSAFIAMMIGELSPAHALIVVAVASGLKDLCLTVGDYLDDGTLNKSFTALILGCVGLSTGCAVSHYTAQDGTKLHQYALFYKVNEEGLRVNAKTGFSVSKSSSEVDAQGINAASGLVSGAVTAAVQAGIKGALPVPK